MAGVANEDSGSWTVECATDLDALCRLKDEWLAFETSCHRVSIFSTFDYISLAWKHFNEPQDRLLVLVIRRQGQLICIAPFKVKTQSWKGIPTRVVQWIARWEGNCPELLTETDVQRCWQRIQDFFRSEFSGWDLLQLTEITDDIDGPLGLPAGATAEVQWDSVGYFIGLDGSFDDYLAKIDTKVKANWRTRGRKIAALLPAPEVEKISEARDMGKAIERFVDLEHKSWKADARIGIGKDQRHQHFYQELTCTFASKGMVALYFLKSGEVDLAGTLLFYFRDVMYERHIAHNPDFSNVSPGVYLRTLVLQDHFGKTWREFDLMGMHPSIGGQRHKSDWSTGQRLSFTYYVYRKFGRLFPAVVKSHLMKLGGRANHVHLSRASANVAAQKIIQSD